ncbi:MAG: DsbA family oxidoreductase [Saprospiraceae bacterium]
MEKKLPTVHLEFISDYICPWCYIGKARLERVKETLKDEINLEIEVSPFLLYSSIPIGGVDKSVFSKKSKPGMGRSLRDEAKLEGIEINYKNIERIPNSLAAHRLTWLVKPTLKYELAKKIFHAYFEDGKNMEEIDFLLEQAKLVGVDHNILEKFATTEEGKIEVNLAIHNAKEAFISVVPSFRLDHIFLIPGLQSIEVWEKYIRRAAKIQQNKNDI